MPLLYWPIHLVVIILLCGLALFCLKKSSRKKWIPLGFLFPLVLLQMAFFFVPEKIANWFEWPDLVFFSQYFPDGRVIIADPRVGEERWPIKHFLALWDGWAIVFEN